jgi:hypothetical protein
MAILIVFAIIAVSIIIAFWPKDEYLEEGINPGSVWNSIKHRTGDISEKAKIEKWIVDSKVNEYGDPLDTLYAGGTPLYDESTGETMDRFDYIKKNYPGEPWND